MELNRIVCEGRYRAITTRSEMRMSHWIDAPMVCSATTGAILLDLSDSLWDLDAIREDGADLVLVVRKYPGITALVELRITSGGDRIRMGSHAFTQRELRFALDNTP